MQATVCPLGQRVIIPSYLNTNGEPSFEHDLGTWVAFIFIATIFGCYLPFHIIHGRRFIVAENNPSHESILIKQNERHEKSMSSLMSFSSGVCMAVGFIFQANGFMALTQLWPNDFPKASRIFGYIVASTFCLFFLIEQLGFVLQDLHAGTCELQTPCAVEVANAPLEAASVVRFLTDHAASAPNLGATDWPPRSDYNSLMNPDETDSNFLPPTATAEISCQMCHQANRKQEPLATGNHWILFFLFALFAVHSLAEGLGLGASACNSATTRQNQTRTVALAILLHKTLSAFAVGAALLRTEVRKSFFWILSGLFSAISPLGALFGFLICRKSEMDHSYTIASLNLIVGGTFLFVALVEFLPKSFEEGSKTSNAIPTRLLKTGLFLLGVTSVFVTMAFNREE